MKDMINKEYFTCFAWAVHKAFKEPLASCRFEQGDMLYDTHKAYEGTWVDALQHLRFSIQIKSPARGTTSKIEKDADSIFSENWRQRVELDLTEYPSKKSRFIITTQGRLYMALWKGDLSILDLDLPEPPVPILSREVLKKLPSLGGFVFQKYAKEIVNPVIFLMPFDETRAILCTKRQKVESCLSGEFHFNVNLAAPEELSLSNANCYVPTLKIAASSWILPK